MGTLYECLREARLERYYPTFRANGITRSEALGQLSMHECVAMGITSVEDRRRMTELINIIKTVHGDGNNNSHPGSSQSQRAQFMPAPRKRNRSPAHAVSHVARASEPVQGATAAERVPNFSAASYMDMLDMASDSPPEEDPSSESEHSDYEPASKFSSKSNRRPAAGAPNRPAAPLDRGTIKKKNKGYNYGVPSAAASQGARPKTRSSQASARSHGDEKIRVCVRKRPLNRREIRAKDVDLVTVKSTTTLIVSEPKQAVDLSAYTLQHEFIFDEVFDESCSNEDVYVRAARPLISCVFNGGKATCFAYGQTGAGKTHTMMGNPEVPGLYLLAAYDIFTILESGQYGSGLKVWISFFEIYCGQLFDLLNRRNRLHAREDGSHQVCIAGLTETEVKDVDALVQVLDYGNSVRSKGATGVNPDSSRSHAVLQLEIRRPNEQKLGRMSFIDLAGSERASDVTDTDRQTRMEGAEINQSLLALKECIRSIDQESRHTPFRQSKLTHILKDSFIGNSRTCMIANISPAHCACEHTLNTLRYADRVKELRRETGNRSSSSSQDMNLLMNIPITAPSIFHPSHLHTSTPIRHTASRQARRAMEPQFDPSETPIRGHNMQRKTATRGSPAKTRGRGGTGRVLPARPAAARATPTEHSPSESDLTDTDSCNLTLPKAPVASLPNIPVVRSTDTDNDFPTSDFNIPEEMNDLNKPPVSSSSSKLDAGGKGGSAQGGKEREGDALAGRDGDAASASSVSKAVTRDETTSSGAAGRPVAGQMGVGPMDRAAVFNPTVKCWADDGGMAAVPSPGHSGSPRRRLPMAGTAPASGPSTPDVSVIGHITTEVSVSVPYSSQSMLVSAQNDSFEDDMLFDAGPVETRPALPTRQPPVGQQGSVSTPTAPEMVTKTKLSVPISGQFGVIPAVLPAESSDLTSIAQRSPLRDNGVQSGVRTMAPSPEPKTVPSSQVPPLPDGGANLGGRRGSQSPSSEASDDSMEGVKSSLSDQGQGPYKHQKERGAKSDLRKEKSDPMLALHMQQKKQTLPKPQEFLKYLSRGGTPKGTPIMRGASPLAVPSGQDAPISMHHAGSEPQSLEQRDSEPSVPRAWPEPPSQAKPDLPRPARDSSPSSGSESRHRHSRQRSSPSPSRPGSGEETREERRRRRRRSSGSGQSDDNAPASRADSLEDDGKSSLPPSLPGTEVSGSSSASLPATSGSTVVKKIVESLQDSRQQQGSHVVMTEKLSTGAVFSPIHPQPITSQPVTRSTIVTRDLLQPKPVTPLWNSVTVDPQTPVSLDKARSDLINAHEMQLANVTSLCKQEMKLLLNAKGGHKSFEDYLKRVGDVLSQKMAAIRLLQDQINSYWAVAPPSAASTSASTSSSAAVSASMVSSISTQQSFNIPP